MTRAKASITGQFVAHRIEMIESPAWRTLSLSGRRVVDRIEIEHGHHGGNDNDRLPVTFEDFEDFGISHKSVAPAIREVVALGIAKITERGRPSESDFGRHPNKFGLTYLPVRRGTRWHEPTDEWKEIKPLEEAEKIAKEARAAKDERAVAKRRASPRKPALKNRLPGVKKSSLQGEKITLKQTRTQGKKITLQSQGEKFTLLSISRERVRPHDRAASNPASLSWPQRGTAQRRRRVEARVRVKHQHLQLRVFERVFGR